MFIIEFFVFILAYLFFLYVTIVSAMSLNPLVLELVEQDQRSTWIIVGVVFLAGISTLFGESAVLFLNRVRRSRFLISLVTNGLVFLISYIVWGFTIYIVGRILFQANPPWTDVVRMVGLSTAPLVFGFLVLTPWMGPFVGKLLNIWSVLILIVIVEYEFKIGFWSAVVCVGLGWLLSLVFTNTVGRPVVALRNKLFQAVSGSKLETTTEDILLHFASADFERLREQGATTTSDNAAENAA